MVSFVWNSFLKSFRQALHSPFGLQLVTLGIFIMFILSFRPPYFLWSKEPFGEEFLSEEKINFPISEIGFLDNSAGVRTAGLREFLMEDEEGNLVVKIQPRKRDETVTYFVKSGDNPVKIAHKFGIKVSTLLWNNGINIKQPLQVGQKLRIPPADGVYYQVQSMDTLGEIAKNHGIELSKIYAYNRIKKDAALQVDQEIFLPDAQKTFVARAITDPTQDDQSGALESIGISIRRPTKGVLTQGFHKGHYAIDIANKLNTPIYASAGGKIIKADSGWNYGYGNHIIIDHGNDVQTLYAHLNTMKVSEGDEIKTGQLIGLMGNSGKVFGPTGIHLHFELHIRGRKVNPNNYF